MCVCVCVCVSCAGLVYTFFSGPGCPSFGFNFDSYGLLTLGTDVGTSTLQHCTSAVAYQAVHKQGGWVGAVAEPNSTSAWKRQLQEGYAPTPAGVKHVCPLTFHFECSDVRWMQQE